MWGRDLFFFSLPLSAQSLLPRNGYGSDTYEREDEKKGAGLSKIFPSHLMIIYICSNPTDNLQISTRRLKELQLGLGLGYMSPNTNIKPTFYP